MSFYDFNQVFEAPQYKRSKALETRRFQDFQHIYLEKPHYRIKNMFGNS